MTQFQRGSITYASSTGARELGSAITADYLAVGGPAGVLGFPINHDEFPTGNGRGRYAQFQRGFIQYSAATGAHETHGLIGARYIALGFENGPLGFPQTDELVRPDRVGRYNRFENGYLFWSPTTGAHEVYGPIVTRWRALGFETGVLGYPTTNPTATADGVGRVQQFQRGAVYSNPVTGVHEVRGAIRDRYLAAGGESGALGYPAGDERVVSPGVVATDFEHGSITWTTATGETQLTTG
jgi:uncharacterized protein with LGFP repeats